MIRILRYLLLAPVCHDLRELFCYIVIILRKDYTSLFVLLPGLAQRGVIRTDPTTSPRHRPKFTLLPSWRYDFIATVSNSLNSLTLPIPRKSATSVSHRIPLKFRTCPHDVTK